MRNNELAKILFGIAKYLQMSEDTFRPIAYRKAARFLSDLDKDIDDIYREGGLKALEDLPTIGEGIALKIEEYLKTGKIKFDKKLIKKVLINLKDKRFLLGNILPVAEGIVGRLRKFKKIEAVKIAGSLRRKRETIGDIDILVVSSDSEKVMDFFVSQPEIVKVVARGSKKCSVEVEDGFNIDLRIIPRESYGSALQYFTGSMEHNVATRKIAISKGLKLNEYGLFKGDKKIAGEMEEGVYKVLGLQWIPPEMRENKGEIELALRGSLPNLIGYNDIKGDLHCHSDWDGGVNSIEALAKTAKEMGYEYIGIADHTQYLKIEHGLDEKQLEKRNKEIDKLNARNIGVKILKGCEANILNDGSIDINDESLAKLDFVIAGLHSSLKMEKGEITERMIKAMQNPNVDIISHPTGRLIGKRDECKLDFDKILRAAKEFGVVLEINSSFNRLDLKDEYIRRAKENGVKMVINSDAHEKDQMKLNNLGIAQARRGWAEKKDIINTESAEELLKHFI
jgi:DNA polymerase (family X)